MARFRDVVVGILIAAFVAGLALMPLSAAFATRMVRDLTVDAQSTGLSDERADELAQEARAYVTGGQEPSSDTASEQGYDEPSISHLRDVRRVLGRVRIAVGVVAAVLAGWLGFEVARRRVDSIARGLRAGAVACVVLVAVSAAVALVDFDRFFAGFHSLFFDPGTWTFPPGTLLIELFPERFWQAMGVAWAGLILAGALVLAGASRAVASTDVARRGSHAADSDLPAGRR